MKEEGDVRPEGVGGETLDGFFGGWTKAEAKAFEDAVAMFEQIDETTWL